MDNAATTPLSKAALDAMQPYLTADYGNASALYDLGQRARRGIEESRRTIAAGIHASPQEVVFTSGGSESDNWVLRGCAEMKYPWPAHIITTAVEHHAILNTLKYLEKFGVDATILPVDSRGFVDPAEVEKAIRRETCLISVMTANNEIGTIEPIAEIGAIAHGHGILFHTDAVQTFGHIPIDVNAMHVDLLSASSHKLNGPKGTGLLYIRRGVKMPSLIFGGAQEHERRAGTENAAGIVGFGAAAEEAFSNMENRNAVEIKLRDHMIGRILHEIPYTVLNGDAVRRLPNNINVTIPYIDSEQLLYLLNGKGICASAGSACASGDIDPSHVLLAIGKSHEDAFSSLRFTISHKTTPEDVDEVVDILKELVENLRRQSVLYQEKLRS